MKGYKKTQADFAAMINRLIRPAPVVPMTRSDFSKTFQKTTDHLRESLNAHYPSSNPSIQGHYSKLGTMSSMLSLGIAPPSPEETRRQLRKRMATTSEPMTLYNKLKSSGELTKETCHAILFNRHLTLYNDINTIATENCIPASFVVAKLMKLKINPSGALDQWIRKVPSISALWEFIRQLSSENIKHKRNMETLEDTNRSLQQVQMDLMAHLSYVLCTKSIHEGYTLWQSWTRQEGIKYSVKLFVLELPSLQLLKNCVRESEAFDIVLAVLEWDDNILRIPAPVATRRQLVLDILDHLVPDATRSERAARVLQLGHDCLEPNEIAEFSETIVKSWSTMSSVLEDVKKVKSFLDWAIVENKNADIHARGRLDRLKYEIDSMQESQRNGGVRLQSSYGSEML